MAKSPAQRPCLMCRGPTALPLFPRDQTARLSPATRGCQVAARRGRGRTRCAAPRTRTSGVGAGQAAQGQAAPSVLMFMRTGHLLPPLGHHRRRRARRAAQHRLRGTTLRVRRFPAGAATDPSVVTAPATAATGVIGPSVRNAPNGRSRSERGTSGPFTVASKARGMAAPLVTLPMSPWSHS